MVSSLLNLVNNAFEGIYRIKCKFGHNDKKCETCKIKHNNIQTHDKKWETFKIQYKYYECFLKYTNFKDDLKKTNVCVVTKVINTSPMKN